MIRRCPHLRFHLLIPPGRRFTSPPIIITGYLCGPSIKAIRFMRRVRSHPDTKNGSNNRNLRLSLTPQSSKPRRTGSGQGRSSSIRRLPMTCWSVPPTSKTRRGTGYYKVPSLKGVWYRSPLEHSGSVATLEDWFGPRRLRDDYAPNGFRGAGVKTRAVKGHVFGLNLSAADRQALIAFLKTL